MMLTLLDSDTISLFFKGHTGVIARAADYTEESGPLIISELPYYEVTRGWKAVGATTQLSRFEKACQEYRIIP